MRASLALLAVLPSALAHFVLNYPAPLAELDEDTEGESPCGGPALAFNNNATNLTVNSFALSVTSTHPQSSWLFRVTNVFEEPYNWTNIVPVISQSGLGDFCEPALSIPASFVGQQVVLQVTGSAADGFLYQCASINFVEGSASSVPDSCKNATGVTATLTTQSSLEGESNASTTSTTSASSSATASTGAGMRQFAGALVAVAPAAMLLL